MCRSDPLMSLFEKEIALRKKWKCIELCGRGGSGGMETFYIHGLNRGALSRSRKERKFSGFTPPLWQGAARGRARPGGGGAGRAAMAVELREALDQRLRDLGIATVTAEHPQVRQPPENPGINPRLASGAQRGQGGMGSCARGFSRSINVEVLAGPGRIFGGVFWSL